MQPPRAQAGDELDRQIESIDMQLGGNTGLSEGLRMRREQLNKLTGRTQNIENYVGGEGGANLEAVQNMKRVPGEAPSGRLQSALSMMKLQQSTLSDSAREEAAALNALTDFILGVNRLAQDEEDRKINNAIKEAQLRNEGYRIEDGTLVPLTDEERMGAALTGQDAVAEVINQGGDEFIRLGKTQAERYAIAESILESGGVKEYRKQLPLTDLITESELKGLQAQNDLNILLTQGIGVFSQGNMAGGTGPLAQFLPGLFVGPNTREMRRVVENIKAQYQKFISGATVPESEAKRLAKFLPSSGKTEQQNLEDMKKLSRDIEINQKIFDLGKRNGLTPDQAFKEYGEQVFEEYGVPYPQKNIKTDDGFDRAAAKAQGYTDEEIDEYLRSTQ